MEVNETEWLMEANDEIMVDKTEPMEIDWNRSWYRRNEWSGIKDLMIEFLKELLKGERVKRQQLEEKIAFRHWPAICYKMHRKMQK